MNADINQQTGAVADQGAVVGAASGEQTNIGGTHTHQAPASEHRVLQQVFVRPERPEAERAETIMPVDDRTSERLDRIYQELGNLRGEMGLVKGDIAAVRSQVNQIEHQLTRRNEPTNLNWTIIAIAMLLAAVISLGTYYIGVR